MDRVIALFALILAVAALCIVGIGEDAQPPELVGDSASLERLAQRVGALEQAVAEQARRSEQVALVPGIVPARASVDGEGESAGALQAIMRRIGDLEQNFERSAIEQEARANRGAVTERVEQDVPTLQIAATDVTLTEEERIQALRQLRFATDDDGLNGRSPEVVSAMIELFHSSTDNGTRADVLRQLDGVTELSLRPVLLNALANDPDADVRSEAAETLGEYLPDALVEDALRYAAQYDSDSSVRKEAAGSLN